jgi:hypothetical protein
LVGKIKKVYANCRIIFNSSRSLAQNTTQICDVAAYLMDLLDLVTEKHSHRTKIECASEKKRLKMIAYIHIYRKSQLIPKTAPQNSKVSLKISSQSTYLGSLFSSLNKTVQV